MFSVQRTPRWSKRHGTLLRNMCKRRVAEVDDTCRGGGRRKKKREICYSCGGQEPPFACLAKLCRNRCHQEEHCVRGAQDYFTRRLRRQGCANLHTRGTLEQQVTSSSVVEPRRRSFRVRRGCCQCNGQASLELTNCAGRDRICNCSETEFKVKVQDGTHVKRALRRWNPALPCREVLEKGLCREAGCYPAVMRATNKTRASGA